MSTHANRQPENPEFTEAQRLLRALIQTAGPEAVARFTALGTGQITLHICDGFLREIQVPTRLPFRRTGVEQRG